MKCGLWGRRNTSRNTLIKKGINRDSKINMERINEDGNGC
jgi:hypothetical protein